jgi:hypothetical protein
MVTEGTEVGGRQRPAYHEEYCIDILGACVQCRVCFFAADLMVCELRFALLLCYVEIRNIPQPGTKNKPFQVFKAVPNF